MIPLSCAARILELHGAFRKGVGCRGNEIDKRRLGLLSTHALRAGGFEAFFERIIVWAQRLDGPVETG